MDWIVSVLHIKGSPTKFSGTLLDWTIIEKAHLLVPQLSESSNVKVHLQGMKLIYAACVNAIVAIDLFFTSISGLLVLVQDIKPLQHLRTASLA